MTLKRIELEPRLVRLIAGLRQPQVEEAVRLLLDYVDETRKRERAAPGCRKRHRLHIGASVRPGELGYAGDVDSIDKLRFPSIGICVEFEVDEAGQPINVTARPAPVDVMFAVEIPSVWPRDQQHGTNPTSIDRKPLVNDVEKLLREEFEFSKPEELPWLEYQARSIASRIVDCLLASLSAQGTSRKE